MVSTPENEMRSILIEELKDLGISDIKTVVDDLLRIELSSTNRTDRRPVIRELANLIDETLEGEAGE